ncbi:MAG: dephospho-CoA kinase [Acidobacteriia bacterium]|nr:dephospho-CoA kinase [Terriglobia bacterium]
MAIPETQEPRNPPAAADQRMIKLGLTGGIACGKSVVAEILRGLGYPVLDADSLAHHLMEPGQPAHQEVLREFGEEVASPSGWIDRKKLGEKVFGNSERLAKLNSIVHPRVAEAMQQRFADWQRVGREIVFVEAALILEAGFDKQLDGVVVAWCRPEQQLQRLLARGLSEDEAVQRIASQLPLEKKKALATELIDCSGTMEDTQRQIKELIKRVRLRKLRGWDKDKAPGRAVKKTPSPA